MLSLDAGAAVLEGREWLITNGIGGYASGTVAGVLTRSYHGLLVSALAPPLGRTVQWVKAAERIRLGGTWISFSPDRLGPEKALVPASICLPACFYLDGSAAVWEYEGDGWLLRKRIWMVQGQNTTWAAWELEGEEEAVEIEIGLVVQHRDFHDVAVQDLRAFKLGVLRDGVAVQSPGAEPFYVRSVGLKYSGGPSGWRGKYFHSIEADRGLAAFGSNLAAGRFHGRLAPGEQVQLVGSTHREVGRDGEESVLDRAVYDLDLLRIAECGAGDPRMDRLILAADQFIVRREIAGEAEEGRSVIAGYHWFGDWGRDTMISLPGLTLATGRTDEARRILRTFARFVDRGMLPNRFPDDLEPPEYNTVDATLWYFEAIRAYFEKTGDRSLIKDLYPVLQEMIGWHVRGTRYGIRMDPADGLLAAGEPGVQLTWMDVKIGDWVVTPRTGKPVEINALWYSALMSMAGFSAELGLHGSLYAEMAERVREAFEKFWNPARGCCYDVIDIPGGGADSLLRPNQVIAASLLYSPLPEERRRAIVDTCRRYLLTPYGLRSLAPSEPGYIGRYTGDRADRDAAYHQGTVWGWLIGPFVTAHYRVFKNRGAAEAFLEPLLAQLEQYGFGTLGEIFDGDPPHTPRGCIAQAWSVAEALRCLKFIESSAR